ncbi:MAG TPA: glycosyltransferase family 4 protein [Nitrospirota bacterium]|nr:glycosyltransferase family 4 protein [Nitrospirota bacterium]
MRIAIVYPSLRAVGGAENVVIWLAESLVERGHYVSLFTWEFSEEVWGNMRERPYNVCLLDFKKHRSTLRTNRDGGMALQRALKLSLYEFDVINPHNYPASLWVYYAKQQMKEFPRVLLYLHNLQPNFYEKILSVHYRQLSGLRNMWNRYRPKKIFRSLRQSLFGYRRLDKAAIASCDSVLANSTYTACMAKKIYGIGVQSCPLGIPLERFKSYIEEASRFAAVNEQRSSLVTVARVEIQKNIDTILKAVKILKERNSLPEGFHYKIAGGGPHLAYFKRKCHSMGLSDSVRFIGAVPHKDVWRLYAESDILIHVPLDEPFGLVPVEAALLKKPSIVSNHGGPSEIVVDGVTGLHADALNPSDIAEKIAELAGHPEIAKKMGEAAYARTLREMLWEEFVKKFELALKCMRS